MALLIVAAAATATGAALGGGSRPRDAAVARPAPVPATDPAGSVDQGEISALAGPSVTATPSPSPSASVSGTAGPSAAAAAALSASPGLDSPRMKDIAQQLVSSAENSSLDWRAQYKYIEDIQDGRGYTGGLIGFTSATDDMLQLVRHYQTLNPGNRLVRYLPALQQVDGTDSHEGLDPTFTDDWRAAAQDPAFQRAQDEERDRVYFDPAVRQAKADGLHALGQFAYYDALVMHGPGTGPRSFGGIRAAALAKARPPSQGGDETAYLTAFLSARRSVMAAAQHDTDRVDSVQSAFLKAGNLALATPLCWTIHGDSYTIAH
ncbi:chitosanase [Kitasatospora sp. MBT63]|uniref:chitosanase n=1 Tax=Kitasatospora sp. MBT63 TaxID=1444768 RepID=UPI001E2B6C07|nr:chitosanase [Kitasatospora sp. MBT63]